MPLLAYYLSFLNPLNSLKSFQCRFLMEYVCNVVTWWHYNLSDSCSAGLPYSCCYSIINPESEKPVHNLLEITRISITTELKCMVCKVLDAKSQLILKNFNIKLITWSHPKTAIKMLLIYILIQFPLK